MICWSKFSMVKSRQASCAYKQRRLQENVAKIDQLQNVQFSCYKMHNLLSSLKTALLQTNPYHYSYFSPSWYGELLDRSIVLRSVDVAKSEDLPLYVIFSSDIELDIPCRGDPSHLSRGLKQGLPTLLDILKCLDITGTFFVEAIAASNYPEILDMIKEQGHEIASHAFSHYENYCQDRLRIGKFARPMLKRELYQKLERSKEILEKISGKRIVSFRAPFTRIDGQTLRALDELGFLYDSSLPNGVFGRIFSYHPDERKYWVPGKLKILEVPQSVDPKPSFRNFLIHEPYRSFRDLYVENIDRAKNACNEIVLLAGSLGVPAIIHIASHSWEFVKMDFKRAGTVTGELRTKRLKELLSYLKEKEAHFTPIDLYGRDRKAAFYERNKV
jgi:peptidoglycan/xylan/chitin deacetylase (PgdA/CDA1 family)